MLLMLFIELVVGFVTDQFFGSESSGFVEIAVNISGGSSTTPISVMVTTTERTAKGEEYINN